MYELLITSRQEHTHLEQIGDVAYIFLTWWWPFQPTSYSLGGGKGWALPEGCHHLHFQTTRKSRVPIAAWASRIGCRTRFPMTFRSKSHRPSRFLLLFSIQFFGFCFFFSSFSVFDLIRGWEGAGSLFPGKLLQVLAGAMRVGSDMGVSVPGQMVCQVYVGRVLGCGASAP